MRKTLGAAALAATLFFTFGAVAAAQQFQLPRNLPSQVLRNPSNVTPNIPVLTGPQLNLENLRKRGIAQRWGLTIADAALRPSIWLTPQRPFVDANTNLATQSTGFTPTTTYTPGTGAPYGSIGFPAAPTGDGFGVYLNVAGATPRTWYLIECYVTDTQVYTLNSTYPEGPVGVDVGATAGIGRYLNPANSGTPGRVSVLFEPSTQANRRFFFSNSHHDRPFVFGGCEITPIIP